MREILSKTHKRQLQRIFYGLLDVALTLSVILVWRGEGETFGLHLVMGQQKWGSFLNSLPINIGVPLGLGVIILLVSLYPKCFLVAMNKQHKLSGQVIYCLVSRVYPYCLAILMPVLLGSTIPVVSSLGTLWARVVKCLANPVFRDSPQFALLNSVDVPERCRGEFMLDLLAILLFTMTIVPLTLTVTMLLVNPIGVYEAIVCPGSDTVTSRRSTKRGLSLRGGELPARDAMPYLQQLLFLMAGPFPKLPSLGRAATMEEENARIQSHASSTTSNTSGGAPTVHCHLPGEFSLEKVHKKRKDQPRSERGMAAGRNIVLELGPGVVEAQDAGRMFFYPDEEAEAQRLALVLGESDYTSSDEEEEEQLARQRRPDNYQATRGRRRSQERDEAGAHQISFSARMARDVGNLVTFFLHCLAYLVALPWVLTVSPLLLVCHWLGWILGLPYSLTNGVSPKDKEVPFLVSQLLGWRDENPVGFNRLPVLTEYHFQRVRSVSSLALLAAMPFISKSIHVVLQDSNVGMTTHSSSHGDDDDGNNIYGIPLRTQSKIVAHLFVLLNCLSISGVFVGHNKKGNATTSGMERKEAALDQLRKRTTGKDGEAEMLGSADTHIPMFGQYGKDRASFCLPATDRSTDYHPRERLALMGTLLVMDVLVSVLG